ncbi:MAG: hypothetical protein WCR72_10865 [Bacteroidota bacterium]
MEESLLRKLKMYYNVSAVLETRKTVWENSAAFSVDVVELDDCIGKIDSKSVSIKGSEKKSKEKQQAGQEMLDAALSVCGAGYAYADKIKDNGIKTQFDYNRSSLKRGNEKEICDRCANIAIAAEPIAKALLDFNMPAGEVDILKETAAAYNGLISAPRSAIKGDKSAKEEMLQVFDDCDKLLTERLDRMMMPFENTQPEFYIEYSNARVIGGWSRGKKKEDGEKK